MYRVKKGSFGTSLGQSLPHLLSRDRRKANSRSILRRSYFPARVLELDVCTFSCDGIQMQLHGIHTFRYTSFGKVQQASNSTRTSKAKWGRVDSPKQQTTTPSPWPDRALRHTDAFYFSASERRFHSTTGRPRQESSDIADLFPPATI